jgi:hypothetical protein
MKWLNIEISILRSPDYVGAEPVERATWLNLLAYCADQENGGIIRNCRSWKCRQWQQTCGITSAEAQLEAQLYQWAGDDLLVCHYPVSKEAELRAKREAGAKGGKASGRARSEAQLEAVLEADLERKGKGNGKVKGMEGEESVPAEVVETPTLEQFKVAASMLMVEEDIAEEIWHDTESRAIAPSGHWTGWNGQPIHNWQANMKARAAAIARKRPAKALTKPKGVWDAKQGIDALKAKLERMKGDPRNRRHKADCPWETEWLPEAKVEVARIREKIRELEGVVAA